MKISVCIPVYNFDVRTLVFDLKKEIQNHQLEIEIVLIDDCSDDFYKNINDSLFSKVEQYILLENNIGRSQIRNLFLQYAKGDFLLFLDCDVKINQNDFLRNYLKEIDSNIDVEVFYGNFEIDKTFSHTLRNRYSLSKEIFHVQKSNDVSLLKTVNCLIKRQVLESYPFDDSMLNYGYEDFVFAKTLEYAKVKFLAFQNPVIHVDETSNVDFLKKTKIAVNTLYELSLDKSKEKYIQDVTLYKVAKKMILFQLASVFLVFYRLVENRILKNLQSNHPNLMNFDFYKLGLLLRKMK